MAGRRRRPRGKRGYSEPVLALMAGKRAAAPVAVSEAALTPSLAADLFDGEGPRRG